MVCGGLFWDNIVPDLWMGFGEVIMSVERLLNNREKNNVCQVICKEILHRNPYRSDRYNFISAIYSFLEGNFCRLFSGFQALVQAIESCYFGFLCSLGFSSQGSVGSPGFSGRLNVFCRWIMGLHGATESIGFSMPVRRRFLGLLLFVFFLVMRGAWL